MLKLKIGFTGEITQKEFRRLSKSIDRYFPSTEIRIIPVDSIVRETFYDIFSIPREAADQYIKKNATTGFVVLLLANLSKAPFASLMKPSERIDTLGMAIPHKGAWIMFSKYTHSIYLIILHEVLHVVGFMHCNNRCLMQGPKSIGEGEYFPFRYRDELCARHKKELQKFLK